MIDSNGCRKYRIGGPLGNLPSLQYVKSWFACRKNKGAKVFVGDSSANEDAWKNDRCKLKCEVKDICD